MRQRCRRHERRILDAHAVMHLVALLESAQNRNGRLHRWLGDLHRLEAPFQRRVFFDVLAVFIERRRAHAAEFAAGKLWLHDVRRVRRTFRRARADDGVQLINEQNDFAFAGDNFLQKRLEPVLEFAAIFRAGNHRAEVHRHQPLVLERFRDVAAHDAPRQALGNRRFAHAGFADEHRVVLGAARQHLHHAADFLVATDDRVNLPLARQRSEVAPVFVERLKFSFGIFVRHTLVAAQIGERLEHDVALETGGGKHFLQRHTAIGEQAEQQMFGADVIVLEFVRLGLRGIERFAQGRAGINLRGALDLVAAGQFAFQFGLQLRGRHADFLEQFGHEAFRLAEQGQQQVLAVHFLVRHFAREALRLRQRLLRFEGQFLRLHGSANLTQRHKDAKIGNSIRGWTWMNTDSRSV